jgi:hypothetical protein
VSLDALAQLANTHQPDVSSHDASPATELIAGWPPRIDVGRQSLRR